MIVLITLVILCGRECMLLWINFFPAPKLEAPAHFVIRSVTKLAVKPYQRFLIKLRFGL